VVGAALVTLAARAPVPLDGAALAAARGAQALALSPVRPLARLGTSVGLASLSAAQSLATVRGAAGAAGSWRALRREFRLRLPVLIYHHVGPRPADTYPELTVSGRAFARHLRWLARWGFTGIQPANWRAWCVEGRPLPPRPVLITFDDAYAGVAEHALPHLQRHRFGGAVFAVVGLGGRTNEWDERHGSGTHRLMSAAQLRACASAGVEVGSHGTTHARLTCADPVLVETEVAESRAALERLLGYEVRAFAYPFHYPRRGAAPADAAVRRTYDLAFTTDEGTNHLATDLHRLRRTMVQPSDTPFDLWCRARLGWSPVAHARSVRAALGGAIGARRGESIAGAPGGALQRGRGA
jgi:peptidoglycan/xylan/chitin deacetylase (PgdA/CDA1 family)